MSRVFSDPKHRARVPTLAIVVDAVGWMVAFPAAKLMRHDFDAGFLTFDVLVPHLAVLLVAQMAIGYADGLYRRHWRFGAFEEVLALTATVLMAGSTLVLWETFVDGGDLSRAVPYGATVIALLIGLATRSIARLQRMRRMRPVGAEPIVVLGAGDGADQIVRTLLNDPTSPYRPIALLDDDPLKQRLRVQGIPVEGELADLPVVASDHGVHTALLAIPSGDSELLRRMVALADRASVDLLVLPTPKQMLWNPVVGDIRPVTVDDLLGRDAVDIDLASVAWFVTGRRVMVTGAGGSIGSELCRQLSRLEPAELVMLDRNESGLHAVQMSIEGRAMLDDPHVVLADIRDAERVLEVFHEHRPDVVFHAAALKHLPLLEMYPAEAWKTNVVGTQNVLDAARDVGVSHFVNISTDKAANPISVLGHSKRLTERLTAANHEADGTYVSVRFGNVLGSSGSVVTAFRSQAEAGGPLTVTHPEVTRYFMTVEEAVRLTIFAAAIGKTGEVLVLDMGEPVRIYDVAQRFAAQHNPPLEIVFTGLRRGEKLHEVLVAADETVDPRVHRLVSHTPVPPISFESLVETQCVREWTATYDVEATSPS